MIFERMTKIISTLSFLRWLGNAARAEMVIGEIGGTLFDVQDVVIPNCPAAPKQCVCLKDVVKAINI